jgi:hypothetical protein
MAIRRPSCHVYKNPTRPSDDQYDLNLGAKDEAGGLLPVPLAARVRRDASHVLPEAVGDRGRRALGGGEGVGGTEARRGQGRSPVRRAPADGGRGAGEGVRVRLGQLRAQLRRRRVEGRGGRVLARAVVVRRGVQDRCCVAMIATRSFLFLFCFCKLATDHRYLL